MFHQGFFCGMININVKIEAILLHNGVKTETILLQDGLSFSMFVVES